MMAGTQLRAPNVLQMLTRDIDSGRIQLNARSLSAAPARASARVALLAGAVPHHREVLALHAHVAGVALHDGLGAAFVGEGLGFRLGGGCVGGGFVGEEGGGGLAGFVDDGRVDLVGDFLG